MALTEQVKAERATHRAVIRKAQVEAFKEKAKREQRPVKAITIAIEWRKSRTWGNNPHAEARVEFHDGTFRRMDGFTASGCGYDKESTVIAEIFNAFLLYKLYDGTLREKWKANHKPGYHDSDEPYGVYLPGDWSPHYSGGIGTSCYFDISKFIGGTFEHVASGKTFDVYKYTDNPA